MIDNKLVIIDGHNLAYRAAHKFSLSTPKGVPTGILFGFIYILRPLIVTLRPLHVVVVFDGGRSSFRKQLLPGYKLRDSSLGLDKDDFEEQLNTIRYMINYLGLNIAYGARVEADDIIYKLIRGRENLNTVIVSSDKDFFPLIKGQIKVYSPSKDKLITSKNFSEVLGFDSPQQFLDYLIIRGDKSDKIPGVPGMGEVRATAFIKEFGSIKNYLDNPTGIWKKYPIKEVATLNKNLINLRTYYLKVGRKESFNLYPPNRDFEAFKKICRQYYIKKFLDNKFLEPFNTIKPYESSSVQ